MRWLLALLPALLTACATTSGAVTPPDYSAQCDAGSMNACMALGAQRAFEGRPEEAAAAYGKACAQGVMDACLTEGRLRMEHGDLDGAEPPLRKTYEAELEEGAMALADLQEARGDVAGAQRLRWDALGIDKSVVEVVFAYRSGIYDNSGVSVDLNVQPMALLGRRLHLGLNVAQLGGLATEFNGYVGYQHFLTGWMAPYARLFLGATIGRVDSEPNFGTEAGMKLFGGALVHLGVAVGNTTASGSYVSVAVGLDWKLFLLILARAN